MQKYRYIYNSIQLNMFRTTILHIFRSTRLCATACGIMQPRCCRPVAGRQHRGGCIIPQAVTNNLVIQKMGNVIAQIY